jgi:hypothetical protein
MRHPLASIALVLPLAAALALPVAAQNRDTNERTTANQIIAQDDARIAQLKANLRLNADQEDAWKRFETALKDISRKRADRHIKLTEEWDKREADADKDKKPFTHAEALRRHADALTFRADEIRAIADAAEPFSEKLNDNQRRRIDEIIRNYVQAPFLGEGPRRRRNY